MLDAARALLGAHLVREPDRPDGVRRVGRIVEVEAYAGPEDGASHARFGPTARNGVMFGPPGHAYVYLVYGMHECLNVVAEPDGRGAAVLIRAVEPVVGGDEMRTTRGARARAARGIATLPAARLAAGPGLVCAAFGIGRNTTGLDLLDPESPIRLEAGAPVDVIVATPRVGIGYALAAWRDVPWRLFDPASPAVSTRSILSPT